MNIDERRARALCANDIENTVVSETKDPVTFRQHVDHNWQGWLPAAQAIRKSDEEAGDILVPKTPTQEMYSAFVRSVTGADSHPDHRVRISDGLDAMIKASPYVANPKGNYVIVVEYIDRDTRNEMMRVVGPEDGPQIHITLTGLNTEADAREYAERLKVKFDAFRRKPGTEVGTIQVRYSEVSCFIHINQLGIGEIIKIPMFQDRYRIIDCEMSENDPDLFTVAYEVLE